MKLNTIFNLVEASVGANLKVSRTARSMKAAADIVYDDCYNALWMFRENKPLWRGNKTPLVDPETVGVLDPSATERVSQNTSNHYTLFFDNHPERANWPKRSRSLICTTSRAAASGYARELSPYAIIPFDHTKIGAINSDDMWNTKLAIPNVRRNEVVEFNETWAALYPNLRTWDDWVRADGDKALNDAAIAFAKEADPGADGVIGNVGLLIQKHGLLATINMMYSNKNLTPAHSVHKTSNLQGVSGEVWVGGKCLVIPSGYWDKFRAEIVSGIHE
jgi:hypothetical protein